MDGLVVEIVWSDPWTIVGLVLFLILCSIAIWRTCRRYVECSFEQV
jgi:hypothetical protein